MCSFQNNPKRGASTCVTTFIIENQILFSTSESSYWTYLWDDHFVLVFWRINDFELRWIFYAVVKENISH